MRNSIKKGFKSGFVVTIGRPNVGKSTLLNNLVGQKVAIMSDKPQTTRHKIHCVLTKEDAQIVFLDTPGVHKPKHRLGQHMVDTTFNALQEVDLVLFLAEVGALPGRGDKFIIGRLAELTNTPVFLVLNKIDTLKDKSDMLPIIDGFMREFPFKEVVPVSALTGENLTKLQDVITEYLPEGPKYYPDDMVTDKPEGFIIAELIREKVLLLTEQEVPYSVAVVIEEMVERTKDLLYVRALVVTERESQKGIIIGKGGSMLKNIGRLARKEIENLLGSRIFLELWVKVKHDWRERETDLKNFGFEL
ncbi:MAG TPA: GTPase Era [Clostridia bacterium]|nr:GTPase Era [Clostridia bacterium]